MSIARIAFAFDAGTFAVMRALLDSEGIPALDMARGAHVAIAGVNQGYYVEVPGEHARRARQLLRENAFGKYLVEPRD